MADAGSGGVSAQRYKVAMYGGGVEELDRFGIRDLIRKGEVNAQTELAIVGTDDWRAASSYPELVRYLDLVTLRPATASGGYAVPVSAKPRDVRPMSERVIHGLTYPVGGGEAITVIGLAALSVMPFFGWLANLASTVIMLSIIRTSADGRLKMPLVDTSNAWDLIRSYFRVLIVTLISLAPVFLYGIFAFRQLLSGNLGIGPVLGGLVIALAIAAIYYPACLATVAVWDNVVSALNPMYVARVIRIIGGDYFVVIAMWFVGSVAAALLRAYSPLKFIPFVGGFISAFLSYWVLFYASHLLGYAVYRHSRELGWD